MKNYYDFIVLNISRKTFIDEKRLRITPHHCHLATVNGICWCWYHTRNIGLTVPNARQSMIPRTCSLFSILRVSFAWNVYDNFRFSPQFCIKFLRKINIGVCAESVSFSSLWSLSFFFFVLSLRTSLPNVIWPDGFTVR